MFNALYSVFSREIKRKYFLMDFYTKHNQGFGHSMESLCCAYEFAKANGMKFAIDDRRWFYGRWSNYFKSDFFPLENVNPKRAYCRRLGQKYFDEEYYAKYKKISHSVKSQDVHNNFLRPGVLSALGRIYKYNDEFGARVSEEVQNFQVEYSSLVSLHIRLGDKLPQHNMDLNAHIELAKKAIKDNDLQDYEVFLMTDDFSIREEVGRALGKPILYRVVKDANPDELRFQPDHLADLLLDVEIAMRSEYFIPSKSDLSRMVRAYRTLNGKDSLVDQLNL
jgi:hypothetical protein